MPKVPWRQQWPRYFWHRLEWPSHNCRAGPVTMSSLQPSYVHIVYLTMPHYIFGRSENSCILSFQGNRFLIGQQEGAWGDAKWFNPRSPGGEGLGGHPAHIAHTWTPATTVHRSLTLRTCWSSWWAGSPRVHHPAPGVGLDGGWHPVWLESCRLYDTVCEERTSHAGSLRGGSQTKLPQTCHIHTLDLLYLG